MIQFSLQGSIAALVTPFKADGSIDYKAFDRYLDFLLENDTNGVIVCGTTGETPTLSEAEDAEMFEHAVRRIDKRVPVIAGTGSNSTKSCIKYTQNAQAAGVDAALVVGPYYNKPTSKGMYLHFAELANNIDIPIILYNVPGRTGSSIKPDVAIRLAGDFENIVGIKEASGSVANLAELLARRPEGFRVYSGDDNLAMLCNLMGGDGCISVACSVFPKEFSRMMWLSIEGDAKGAREIFFKYRRLIDLLFIESNPIPVKAALAAMGIIEEVYRAPLCSMEDDNKKLLLDEMKRLKLI